MQIHSFSKLLYLPLGLGILAAWYWTPDSGNQKVYFLLPLIVLVVANYLFAGETDHWWLKKHPIGLDPKAKSWLEKFSPYYRELTETQKTDFGNRLNIYMNAREYKMMKGKEKIEVPQDIKLAISHLAIMLTFYQEDYLIGDFDRIYFYGHPFPTPHIKDLHTVETEPKDGLILLDIKHTMPGITDPDQFYNIALHAYVEAYLHVNNENLPEITVDHLSKLSQVAGYPIEPIVSVIGHDKFEPEVVMITLFFTYPEKFASVYPVLNEAYTKVFKKVRI